MSILARISVRTDWIGVHFAVAAGAIGDCRYEETPMTYQKEKKTRPPPELTVGWLKSESIRHLQRWPATERRIRQLLWKRVGRAQGFHGGERGDAVPLVEEAVAYLKANRLIDDGRFAKQ